MSKYLSQYSALRKSARAHHPVRTLVGVGAGAAGTALLTRTRAETKIGNMTFSTPGLVAATLLGASALGLAGRYSTDVANLGIGALALYLQGYLAKNTVLGKPRAASAGGPWELGAGPDRLSHEQILRAARIAPSA